MAVRLPATQRRPIEDIDKQLDQATDWGRDGEVFDRDACDLSFGDIVAVLTPHLNE